MTKFIKPIVFLHIPKTGGSTFNHTIQSIANENNISYLREGERNYLPKFSFDHFKPQETKNFLSGHFVFSDQCKNVDLYTIVRDVHKSFFSNLYFKYFHTYQQKKRNLDNVKKIIEINNFLSSKYQHHSFTDKQLESNPLVPEWVKKVYQEIISYQKNPENKRQKKMMKVLDVVSKELDEMSHVFENFSLASLKNLKIHKSK